MTNIIPFKKTKASEKYRGNTLCRSGHHKWLIEKDSVFDSKQGRLVTLYRCVRCKITKTRAF